MPSRKATVYLTEETLRILGATSVSQDETNVSGRINAIVQAFDLLVKQNSPEFTLAEWCAICDANNGVIFDDHPSSLMWANVYDCVGLGDKWGVDQFGLVDKIRALAPEQSVALAEIVQRFWSDCTRMDNEKWLKECGAKIKE